MSTSFIVRRSGRGQDITGRCESAVVRTHLEIGHVLLAGEEELLEKILVRAVRGGTYGTGLWMYEDQIS